MFKIITAGLMAITMTVSSATSTQAQGLSDEDVGKLLFGILATAAIAHAINENKNDRSDRSRQHEPTPQIRERLSKPQGVLRHQSQPRQRIDHSVLPRDCVRRVERRNGTQRILGRRCLERNYASAASLPDQCLVRFRTERGARLGYGARCLRQMGYSFSSH